MKSCTKTRACARRTRKRVGRILTMGETHSRPDKQQAGQARLAPPDSPLFCVRPIPPCETSHAEQPSMPRRTRRTRVGRPAQSSNPAQACGPNVRVYPAALFVSPFAEQAVAKRVQLLHKSAFGLRIREVSRCVRLAVRLVRQQSISPHIATQGDNFERLEIVAEKHWNIILG